VVDADKLLFTLLWIGVGYVALHWIARRYFTQPHRAAVFAATVALAFAAGALWPFSDRGGRPGTAIVSQPAAAPAQPQVTLPKEARVDGSICRNAHAGGDKTRAVIDFSGLIRAGQDVAMPAHFAATRSDVLVVEGWAVNPDSAGTVSAVCLTIDNVIQPRAVGFYGLARPDVAAALGSSDFTKSGFRLQLPIRELSAGQHLIGIAVVSSSHTVGMIPGTAIVYTP